MFIWKMMNMGEVEIAGADFNATSNFHINNNININLSANYSYQYAIDVTDPSSKNYKHQIPYTPKNSGNISLSVINKWVNFGYTASFVGKRYALPENIKSNLIDGYCEQNISLNREFLIKGITLRLQGEVLNIGNVNYDVIKYYPMPGRQYRITLNVKF